MILSDTESEMLKNIFLIFRNSGNCKCLKFPSYRIAAAKFFETFRGIPESAAVVTRIVGVEQHFRQRCEFYDFFLRRFRKDSGTPGKQFRNIQYLCDGPD